MSCSLRDAVELESCGIPTIVIANDVFLSIARSTAHMLGLPPSYADANVIYLPHPTSILTRSQAAALIDGRIEQIELALLGRRVEAARDDTVISEEPVEIARHLLAELRSSLKADGADVIVESYRAGVLDARILVDNGQQCASGSCLLPPEALRLMIDSLLRKGLPELHEVRVHDARAT